MSIAKQLLCQHFFAWDQSWSRALVLGFELQRGEFANCKNLVKCSSSETE